MTVKTNLAGWWEIADELNDSCGNGMYQDQYIAIGKAKRQVLEKIGDEAFHLIKAIVVGELYRRAAKADEECIIADDLLVIFDSAIDHAATQKDPPL